MDEEKLSSSPASFASQVSVESPDFETYEAGPTGGNTRVSPVFNLTEQQAGSSNSVSQEPQGTSQVQDHDRGLQGQDGHDTQRDTGGLQACLKHTNASDHARSASEAHFGGVESTTTENTPASQRNPFAKPSLGLFRPASAIGPPPKASDSIKQGPKRISLTLSSSQATANTTSTSGTTNTSNPFRKSLPGTSSLQIKSAKENNAFLSTLNKIRNPKPKASSSSDSAKKPSFDSTKKSNLPSSISDSIKYPNRSLSAASRKAYSQKKSSKSSSSSKKTAQSYKLGEDSSGGSVLFKGNPSYYTPFDPKTSDVANHSSHRAIDGTMPMRIKIRKSTGGKKLDSSSQASQLGPAVPLTSHTSPLKGTQPTRPASNGDANPSSTQSKVVGSSELALDTSKNIQSSQDSELSEVDSIDPRSFGSTNQSPTRVIPNSGDEDDGDGDTDENNNLTLYDSDNNDESSIIISSKKDNGQNTKAGADQPAKSFLSTKYTRSSALNDAPYLVCKDQFGNIVKTEGALIPVSYQHLDGDFPWICPVRSCRTMHRHIKSLGNHFSHGHKASCYNDNLDGTLTFMGLYTKQLAKQPPIIVSKKAMSLDESPMREPSHTAGNRYKYGFGLPEKSLPEELPRNEEQSKEGMHSQAITAVQDSPLPKPKKTLTMADSVRPYNMWPDSSGKLEQLCGGLLPSGWTPYLEYPERQWICPIRSCQCLMASRWQFGRHFLIHRGCHLNDNMDGTFTILRSPSQAELNKRDYTDTSVVVVSRESLDNEPIQPPKIRIKDPSGTQKIWVSLSSYLESDKKRDGKSVTKTLAEPAKTPHTIVQSEPNKPSSKRATKVNTDEELIMATKDRKYSYWRDTDQNLKYTHGALIPEGYELDQTWPGRLWICPIRSCRVVCKNMVGLGNHFRGQHPSATLNDNEDGTLSILGTHSHGAPRVVSKRHISLLEDPIVEPCLPVLKKSQIEEEEKNRQRMATRMDKPTAKKPTITNSSADPDALWKYLCDMTKPDLLRPPHPSFERLMALPRLRDLNVVGKDALTPKHLMRRMLAGALAVQVTGVERQVKQCTACRRGDGPFQECVSICPELAVEISKATPLFVTGTSAPWTCMNCVLNQCFQRCSLKGSLLERLEDGTVKEKVPHWMLPSEGPASTASVAVRTKSTKASASQEKDGSVADDEADKDDDVNRQDAASFSYRRSGRIRSQAESASATPSEPQPSTRKRSFASMDMAASTSQQMAATIPATSREEEDSGSSSRAPKRLRGMHSLASAPPATVQESLMIDDWEKEDKAITTTGENGSSENLAFSSLYNLSSTANSHLTTSTTQIFSSPSFSAHIIKIPEGESHHFQSQGEESDQTRMCTVVAGKLRVKIKSVSDEDDETDCQQQEFNIGLHGLFKLTGRMECKVENWGYNMAVLQVTTIGE